MVLSPGSSIVAICASSSVAISAAYVVHTILNIHCSDFITNIEVLEMAKVTSIAAQNTSSSKYSFAGQDMSPGWKTYQKLYCIENCPLARGQRGTSEKIQRHLEKVPRHLQHQLPAVDNCERTGDTQSTRRPPPLKSKKGPTWKTKGEGRKTWTLLK